MSKKELITYPVYIPQNIDLNELLLSHPVINVPNAKDYLLYILSLIPLNGNLKPLNSTKLQKIVDNYRDLLTWLIARGILETSNRFKINEKSKEYKLAIQYITDAKEEFITKQTLVKRMQNLQVSLKSDNSDLIQATSQYGYQTSWRSAKEIAASLNLKPTKMVRGLESLGVIEKVSDHNITEDFTKEYYYRVTILYSSDGTIENQSMLFIKEDFMETIKAIANENPVLFPLKIKPKSLKRRKSPNI